LIANVSDLIAVSHQFTILSHCIRYGGDLLDDGEAAASQGEATADGKADAAAPLGVSEPGEPAKRAKRETMPAGLCRACWNISRGNTPGVGHLYKPPCTKPPPNRGKASGRGASRRGASQVVAPPVGAVVPPVSEVVPPVGAAAAAVP